MFGGSLVRGACREDLQDHGPGDEGRRAGDRPQRFRRRAHPGGRRLARRLCRRVPAQRAGLGRRAADLADHGAVRRRRGLFAGDDRLHLHGEGLVLHVRDRAGRGEDRDARDRDARGAGRRRHAHDALRRRRPGLRERRRGAAADAALLDFLPASNREKPPVRPTARQPATGRAVARHAGPGQPEQALRHEGADPEGRRRGRLLRDPARLRRATSSSASAASRARRSASSPTSRWCWPAASTSTRRSKARALRALLRLLQHPDRDLRRRARLSAGHGAGIRRHHQARRQAAVRLSPRRPCPRSR